MVKTCFLCKINKIWAHIIKYQTKKVVQHIIKGSILIKLNSGPFEANPTEDLCFFDDFWTKIRAPGRGLPSPSPRGAKMGRIWWKPTRCAAKPQDWPDWAHLTQLLQRFYDFSIIFGQKSGPRAGAGARGAKMGRIWWKPKRCAAKFWRDWWVIKHDLEPYGSSYGQTSFGHFG